MIVVHLESVAERAVRESAGAGRGPKAVGQHRALRRTALVLYVPVHDLRPRQRAAGELHRPRVQREFLRRLDDGRRQIGILELCRKSNELLRALHAPRFRDPAAAGLSLL